MRALPPALLAALIAAASLAHALPVPHASDGIGPGSKVFSEVDGAPLMTCTANWVWREVTTGALYLGAAGHCVLPVGAIATHGAGANYDASRTRVKVCLEQCDFGGQAGNVLTGALAPLGALAYARQGEAGVDFALVEIPPELASRVRPAMTTFGAPTHIGIARPNALLCVQGMSVGAGEHYATQSRVGMSLGSDGGRWWAAYPGAYGDSGAAVATCAARGDGLRASAAVGFVTSISPYADRPGIAGTTIARATDLAFDADLAVEPLLG